MKLLILVSALLISMANAAFGDVVVIGNFTQDNVAAPGGSFQGVLLLKNTDAQEAHIRLYQTDYLFYSDGRNLYGDSGSNSRSNARWIVLSQSQVVVPPKSTVNVSYQGNVPGDPTLQGTYWSMIMVEPLSASAAPTPKDGKVPTMAIQTVVRYAIQVATEIGNAAVGNLKILDKRLAVMDGKTSFLLDVENTGERRLTPVLSMELYDEQGKSYGKLKGGTWRIYPSCSVRYRIDLSSIPEGKYVALALMDSGDDNIIGVRYELQIKD